ncbi:MAG TPA: FHA domain-containing protein [Candidatus Methylomirabilis sp.]|nr:FHA domain-containing protein [Candidatus Methylomirabilis sp.]
MVEQQHPSLSRDNPWPGLDPFDERDREYFHGRREESGELLRHVSRESLTVLFGRSGLGKTSLLKAGLFPLLRAEDYLPVYVRLDHASQAPPLRTQILDALRTTCDSDGVEAAEPTATESLWAFFHRRDAEFWSRWNHPVIPVVVLDQLEEIFTLGQETDAARARSAVFFAELGDLIENRSPAEVKRDLESVPGAAVHFDFKRARVKLVPSFREDFLAEMEVLKGQIPSLMYNRFRLQAMNGRQAYEVITLAGGHLVDDNVARRIIGLAWRGVHEPPVDPADFPRMEIDPALLSVVCTELNHKRQDAKPSLDRITSALLEGADREILSGFYERSVAGLDPRVRVFVEDELITERGFRDSYALEDALSLPGVSREALDVLITRRLLRVDERQSVRRLELTHDVLTRVVRDSRDTRRAWEEVAEAKAREKAALERQRRNVLVLGSISVLLALLLLAAGASTYYLVRARHAEESQKEEESQRRRAEELQKQAEAQLWKKNRLEAADSDHKSGVNLVLNNQYGRALEKLQSAFSAYEELGEVRRMVTVLVDIGKVKTLQKEYGRARETYEQARRIVERIGSGDGEGLVLESLASLSEQQGRRTEALQYYSLALTRYQEAGEQLSSARVLERLAVNSEESRDFDRAVQLYQRTLGSYTISGDQLAISRVKKALQRIIPWGVLTNLKTSETHQLRGERITVGRNSPDAGIYNDISFPDTFVSRRHLVINHDNFQADDLRSRNGTAVNGKLLPYGVGVKLADGDIITLANLEVLQFRTVYSPPLHPPAGAWAIVINGDTRNYQYLTDPEYSLTRSKSAWAFERGFSPSALLKLRRVGERIEVFEVDDEWKVMFEIKESDYEYKRYVLKSELWVEAMDTPSTYVRISSDGKNILEEGPSFQVVPLGK